MPVVSSFPWFQQNNNTAGVEAPRSFPSLGDPLQINILKATVHQFEEIPKQ